MRNSKGQALVLVLLSMSVVLTIVLFILSRSVTDIAVSTSQEDAVRAFSAAEAGIEKALIVGTGSSTASIGDASYSTTVSAFAQGSSTYIYPLNMDSGESATVWFVEHDDNSNIACDATHDCFTGNQIKICWGKPTTSSSNAVTPAVEMIVFYESTPKDATTLKIARAVFDPYTSRTASNGFSTSDSGPCSIADTDFAFGKTITFSSLGIPAGSYNFDGGLQFARVRMFYNTDTAHGMGVDVGFAGNSLLPSQGQNIVSTGTSGDSNRRVELFQGWPEVPKPFEFAIYSSTSLTK